jgi:hypothetical protein
MRLEFHNIAGSRVCTSQLSSQGVGLPAAKEADGPVLSRRESDTCLHDWWVDMKDDFLRYFSVWQVYLGAAIAQI